MTTPAPASRRWFTRRRPTLPTPSTPTWRPSRLGAPQLCSAAASIPRKTPNAGSPGGGTGPPPRQGRPRPGGVPRPAVRYGPPRDVAALAGDDVHVLAVRADVARGDVAAVQRFDEPPVGAQQGLGLVPRRVTDDDAFTAAEVQARQCVLVRHRPGEVERVSQGVVLGGVRIEAGPAERGAEGRGVDGNDRPEAGLGVLAEDNLLMPCLAAGRLAVGCLAAGAGGLLTCSAGLAGHVGWPVRTCEHLGHVVTLPVRFRILGYAGVDRKSTRLNSSHANISYAVFCLKKKKKE